MRLQPGQALLDMPGVLSDRLQRTTDIVANLSTALAFDEQFSAIINPPHAAILAVGATQQKPAQPDG